MHTTSFCSPFTLSCLSSCCYAFSQNAEDCFLGANQDVDVVDEEFGDCLDALWEENEPNSEDDYCINIIDVCTEKIIPDGLCQDVMYKSLNCHLEPHTTFQCTPPSKSFVLDSLEKNLRA